MMEFTDGRDRKNLLAGLPVDSERGWKDVWDGDLRFPSTHFL
jgi:hypothetical protein